MVRSAGSTRGRRAQARTVVQHPAEGHGGGRSLLGVHIVISWIAVVIGVAFVLVGGHIRGRIVRRWGEPAVLRSWWARAALITAAVVSLGVPAMNGHVVLAPFYGLGLGLLSPRPRRWREATHP